MLYDNRMNRRGLRRAAEKDGRGAGTAGAVVLVLLAATLCAAWMSSMYMRLLLAEEAAHESRFVNGVVREASLHRAFYGRAEEAVDRLHAALWRPDLRYVELVSAGDAGAGEPLRTARALRGEGVGDTTLWRWSIPLRPALWRTDPDAGPALEFAVPVFDPAGSVVIGAALLRRSPAELAPTAGRMVIGIWLVVTGGTLGLYGTLLAVLRRRASRPLGAAWGGCGARAPAGSRVATVAAWRKAESDLRRHAVRRRVHVESVIGEALPALRGSEERIARAIEAFARHGLARARQDALLQFSVRATQVGVEFSCTVANATEEREGSMAGDTRALVRAAEELGGSMLLVITSGVGLRAVLTLPA